MIPLPPSVAEVAANRDWRQPVAPEGPSSVGQAFGELLMAQVMRGFRESMTESMFGSSSGASTYGAWFDEIIGREFADHLDFDKAFPSPVDSAIAKEQQSGAERAALEAYSGLSSINLP